MVNVDMMALDRPDTSPDFMATWKQKGPSRSLPHEIGRPSSHELNAALVAALVGTTDQELVEILAQMKVCCSSYFDYSLCGLQYSTTIAKPAAGLEFDVKSYPDAPQPLEQGTSIDGVYGHSLGDFDAWMASVLYVDVSGPADDVLQLAIGIFPLPSARLRKVLASRRLGLWTQGE